MLNPLSISVDGYLRSTLSVSVNGYLDNFFITCDLSGYIFNELHKVKKEDIQVTVSGTRLTMKYFGNNVWYESVVPDMVLSGKTKESAIRDFIGYLNCVPILTKKGMYNKINNIPKSLRR